MYTSLLVEMSRQEGSSKVISEHGKDSLRAASSAFCFLPPVYEGFLPFLSLRLLGIVRCCQLAVMHGAVVKIQRHENGFFLMIPDPCGEGIHLYIPAVSCFTVSQDVNSFYRMLPMPHTSVVPSAIPSLPRWMDRSENKDTLNLSSPKLFLPAV